MPTVCCSRRLILLSVPRFVVTILVEIPEHVVVAGGGVVVLDLRMIRSHDGAGDDLDAAVYALVQTEALAVGSGSRALWCAGCRGTFCHGFRTVAGSPTEGLHRSIDLRWVVGRPSVKTGITVR